MVLKIKVKNIEKIRVKIYELNLEKHYIQSRGPVQDDMDLHFLDPTYQFVYEVSNSNPFKEEFYDMSLKEVKKERGVYIVDIDWAEYRPVLWSAKELFSAWLESPSQYG